jgi:hypothetical protein
MAALAFITIRDPILIGMMLSSMSNLVRIEMYEHTTMQTSHPRAYLLDFVEPTIQVQYSR